MIEMMNAVIDNKFMPMIIGVVIVISFIGLVKCFK